jgi:hypothetical protein
MTLLYSKAQADEFFKALREASVTIMEHYGLPTSQGPKRYKEWKHGFPLGITEHFTAGPTWKGSVRWLNDGPHKNSVSCQMLILDRMLPPVEAIYTKYPELAGLKVTTILMSEGVIPCWHAGWVNRLNFGIENRNAGPLLGTQENWTWWAKKWTAKFPHEQLGKWPINLDGKWWEPYTHGQVVANIIVGQMLYCLNGSDALDPRWFLPHSATTGTKYDTGRAYPLHDVREAVFKQYPVEELPWLHKFKADPQYMDDYDEDMDEDFLREMAERQADREGEELPEGYEVAEEPPGADLQDLVDDGNWKEELGAVRRGLHQLGYYVPGDNKPELDNDTALAVYQFQVSMKLKADKIPGSKTQKALVKRLKQFGLWR